jgi:hypothetical protein
MGKVEEVKIEEPQPIKAPAPEDPKIVAPNPSAIQMTPSPEKEMKESNLKTIETNNEKDNTNSRDSEEEEYDIEEIGDYDQQPSKDFKTIEEALEHSQRGLGQADMSESERKYFTKFGLLPPTAISRDPQSLSNSAGSQVFGSANEKTTLLPSNQSNVQQQTRSMHNSSAEEQSCCIIL